MKNLILLILGMALTLHAETVKIGVILPLTGNNASYGQLCLNGVRFFEHELKERVAKGELKNHYEIIVEDDQMLNRMTAEALNKLANVDHVQALVSTTGGSGNVIRPIAEQKKILHICVTTDISVAKGEYNFTHWTPPQAEAPLLVEILKRKGLKRVAIVNARHQGMMLMAKCVKDDLKKVGITPVFEAQFNPGERDFRMLLMQMNEAHPDALVIQAFSPEMGIIFRQKKELGINTFDTSLEMFDFINDQAFSEGKYMVSGAAETPGFVARLKAFIPDARPTYSGYFYDSLNLLVDSFERFPALATNLERANWLAQVKDYPSAVGDGRLTMGEGHIVWTKASYYVMRNNEMQPTTLEEILKNK